VELDADLIRLAIVPTREIKESSLTSQTLAALSHGAERCFFRLTLVADDFGRFEADPELIRSRCYPRMLDKVKPAHLAGWLHELVVADLIRLYEAETTKSPRRAYGYFPTWLKHQRQRAKWSKYPAPPPDAAHYHGVNGTRELPSLTAGAGTRRQVAADVAVVTEEPDTPENTETPEETARTADAAVPGASNGGWQIPDPVIRALARAPHLARIQGSQRLREDPAWWYAQTRAHPALDVAACVLAAEAWLVTNPGKASRKRDAVKFLHNWFRNEES